MTVVVGLTTTPEGTAAVEAAIAEARLRHQGLLLVNATRGDSLVDDKYVSASALEALRERLTAEGVEHEIEQVIHRHDPADAILAAATRAHAELIVLGLRRRTPVGKLILGSTSQRILLNADAPVMCIKASETAHQHFWQRSQP